MQQSISDTVAKICSSGLATSRSLKGCSSEEVRNLQQELGFSLPASYSNFLIMCGRGAGEFLIGTNWMYPDLKGLQKQARELLVDCKCTVPLTETAFVFAMYQGYQFLFFDCADGDDPPVFRFVDSTPSFEEVFPTFSEWLSQCVDDEIAAQPSASSHSE